MNVAQHWRLKSIRYQLQHNNQNEQSGFLPHPQTEQRVKEYYEYTEIEENDAVEKMHTQPVSFVA